MLSCFHDDGGFGAAPGHDAHILYTVSAVQILATIDGFEDLDKRVLNGKKKIGECKEYVLFVIFPLIASLIIRNRYSQATGRRNWLLRG